MRINFNFGPCECITTDLADEVFSKVLWIGSSQQLLTVKIISILWCQPIELVLPVIYYYMIKSWRMRWSGHERRVGGMVSAYKIFVANPEGSRTLEGLGSRLDNKIKLKKFKDLGCEGMYFTHLANDRNQWRTLVKTVMNLRFS